MLYFAYQMSLIIGLLMLKLTKASVIFFILIFSSSSIAGFIKANSISHQVDDVFKFVTFQTLDEQWYDIIWASTQNVEYASLNPIAGCSFADPVASPLCNKLSGPTDGWNFYSDANLSSLNSQYQTVQLLMSDLHLELFGQSSTRTVFNVFNAPTDVVYQGFSHWNSNDITGTRGFSNEDNAGSYWADGSVGDSSISTIYFRRSDSVDVPEPSTLLIFSLGLLSLVGVRKRKIS